MTVTRDGATLLHSSRGRARSSGVPLEATAEDKFKIDPGVVFEFDAAEKSADDQTTQWGKRFHEEKMT